MHSSVKLLMAATAATLLLGLAAAGASAGRLSASNGRFRLVWSNMRLGSSSGTFECPVTLEGSFHSATMKKIVEALIGYISRATAHKTACSGGALEMVQESLPWHIRYRGFQGTLPVITGINLGVVGSRVNVEFNGNRCQTGSTAREPDVGILLVRPEGAATTLRVDETASVPLEGEILCGFAGKATISGTATVSVLGTATAITVRLI